MAAPCLALVPGLNNTAQVWDGVVPGLADAADCRALDCPALDTVEAVADALLAQLPPRFFLAGFSFGGYVALAMLARAPERVAGLALVNSATRADTDLQRAARAKSILAAQAGEHESLMAAQAGLVFHPSSLANAALMAQRSAMVRAYGSARFMAHLKACSQRPDRTALLAASACPVLVVAAREDRVIAFDHQRAMAHAITHARFVEIADAGHMMPLEQPAALAQALRAWITSPPLQP